MPSNDLDGGSHCYADQDALIFQLGAWPGPFRRWLFANECLLLLLAVGSVPKPRRQDVPACLIESWSYTGVVGNHEEYIFPSSRSKDEGILDGPPPNCIDGLIAAQLSRPDLPACQEFPHSNSSIVTTARYSNTRLIV